MFLERIKVVKGTDPEAAKLIRWLIRIYNEDRSFNDGFFDMRDPESVSIIYIEGVGGVILDYIYMPDHTPKKIKICQYLCIEKGSRGKGYAHKLIDFSKRYAKKQESFFIGAYVESSTQLEIWKSLGFPYQGSIGFAITAFCQSLNDIEENGITT